MASAARIVLLFAFFPANGCFPVFAASERPASPAEDQPERKNELPADVSALLGILGKRLDDRGVVELISRLNQGMQPVVRAEGDAVMGESLLCFLTAAGVILRSSDHSGTGQTIGQVTLAGRPRKVYPQGRELSMAAYRGPLPLSLRWGETRSGIRGRLEQPTLSNEGISASERPKSPIGEIRDADEYQRGNLIIRLIYASTTDGPGSLEEIDFQCTSTRSREDSKARGREDHPLLDSVQ